MIDSRADRALPPSHGLQDAPDALDPDTAHHVAAAKAKHWRLTRRLTAQLLIGWLVLTFVIIFFARELDRLSVFGWPLSFYLAAQGATLAYVGIVGLYAWRMARLDRRYRKSAQFGEPPHHLRKEARHGE